MQTNESSISDGIVTASADVTASNWTSSFQRNVTEVNSSVDDPALTVYSAEMSELSLIDWFGFAIQAILAIANPVLNGFMAWVFYGVRFRTPMDVVQMNQAACDLIDGCLGPAMFVWSRILLLENQTSLTAYQLHAVSVILSLVCVTYEDLTSIFLSLLRTKQVSVRKWSHFIHLGAVETSRPKARDGHRYPCPALVFPNGSS